MAGYDAYGRSTNSQQQGTTTLNSVATKIFGSASSATGATIKYMSAPGTVIPSATAVVLGVATQAGTIQNLSAFCTTAPAGSDTVVFTVMTSVDSGANYTASTLTCTITGTAVSASDTTHQVAVAVGTLLAIRINSSGTTAAAMGASFELA